MVSAGHVARIGALEGAPARANHRACGRAPAATLPRDLPVSAVRSGKVNLTVLAGGEYPVDLAAVEVARDDLRGCFEKEPRRRPRPGIAVRRAVCERVRRGCRSR